MYKEKAVLISKTITDEIEKQLGVFIDRVAIKSAGKYFRTGRVVKTKNNTVSFTKPEPLATKLTTRTGRLIGSILGARNFRGGFSQVGISENIREIGKEGNRIKAVLGSTVPYAAVHEEGTARVHSRPFLKPAFNEEKSFLDKLQVAISAKDFEL